MSSNSQKELERLTLEYLEANFLKNKYNNAETKLKKEIQAFSENQSASLELEHNGKGVKVSLGEFEVDTFVLDAKALYKYAVETEQEDRFWECVNVVKERAAKVFSERQLAVVTKQVKNKTWTIKKEK